jgi:dsRNA-specific ribonuclease
MTEYFSIQLPEDEIRAISSIGLAHLGDAVFELLVRTYLCAHGKATGKGLHRATIELVCAPAQARAAEKILPLLTEEEQAGLKKKLERDGATVMLDCHVDPAILGGIIVETNGKVIDGSLRHQLLEVKEVINR